MPKTHRALNSAALKDLYERQARAMTRRPSFARGSGQACIHMSEGLACDVHHDDHLSRVDQPESEGGTGTGPHPGQLMRASIGACLAMGYRLWGARLGTPIDAVDVELTCEYDARGQMGLAADVAIGWQRIQYHVVIISPASQDDIRRVVDTADRLSPMLANLSPAVERTRRLTIVSSRSGTGEVAAGYGTDTTAKDTADAAFTAVTVNLGQG